MWNDVLQLLKTFEQNAKVFIGNQEAVLTKVSKLVEDGKTKLQIIADFDWTLTKSNVDGIPTMHCYDIFSLLSMLNTTYHYKKDEFLHKYIELLSKANSDEEKHEISKQWFNDHEQLILGVKISIEDLKEALNKADAPLRDGCAAFIETLAFHDIPLIICSSGIGDIIQLHLQQHGIQHYNTVANFLHLDNDIIKGFNEPFVSTYNKDQLFFPVTNDRPNIILIGDSIEDHKMSDSIPNKGTVLKIGFCPDTSKVAKYQRFFDIVLINDQTMDTVEALTSLILNNKKKEEKKLKLKSEF